jgi:repressor LexA
MHDTREIPDRPHYAVGASRGRVHANVRDFLQDAGRPASVFEVCDIVALEVTYRFKLLQQDRHSPSGARSRFADWERRVGTHALYVDAHDLPGELSLPVQIGAIELVPVWGRIPAGPLNLASQAVEGAFLLDRRYLGEGRFFMLKVAGDSMINAGIADGSWLVVRQQQEARDGQIVAAMIDGEVTVKTLHQEPGVVELVPQNRKYKPIPVDELSILGVVVGVVDQALRQMKVERYGA